MFSLFQISYRTFIQTKRLWNELFIWLCLEQNTALLCVFGWGGGGRGGAGRGRRHVATTLGLGLHRRVDSHWHELEILALERRAWETHRKNKTKGNSIFSVLYKTRTRINNDPPKTQNNTVSLLHLLQERRHGSKERSELIWFRDVSILFDIVVFLNYFLGYFWMCLLAS